MPYIAAILALGWAAPALAEPPTASPLRDGSHDMDFSFGRWRTEITVFKDPFHDPAAASHMTGTKTVRPVWNGKAAIEEIEADGPDGHWEAANLMLYDPVARQWSQNYVDSASGRLDRTPGVGEFRDGKLEFHWRAMIGTKAVLARGTWSDFTPNSHTYEVARSDDGGRSWHTSFVAHLTRIN